MQRDLFHRNVQPIQTNHYLLTLKNDVKMPATKSKLERKCEVCGNHFIAKTIYSKYCSKHCSEVASRQKKKQKKLEEQKQQLVSMIPDERPYISIPEAVAMFGISRDTIYRLIRKGKLPAINLGERLTRINREQLETMFPAVQKQQTIEANVTMNYKFDDTDSYTIGEISKKYGVSDSTVYKAIRRGGIPKCQKGKYVYVPKNEIDKVFNAKN